MSSGDDHARLDRHALVTSVWAALGLVAVALFGAGFGSGGWPYVAAGFAVVSVAFVAHVIVNAVHATTFTARELALGLVVYGAGVLAFVIACLVVDGFAERNFLVVSLGLLVIFVGVVFYMLTHFGARRVFEAFDVIRDVNRADVPRRAEGDRP